MDKRRMEQKKEALNYWLKSSEDDWDTAEQLLKAGKNHHALFFCHLSLEKGFKAILVKSDKTPPPIHNLYELALKTKLTLPKKFDEYLNTISTFNLEARYDSYKLSFYKKATAKYTKLWFERAKEIKTWQKKHH